MNQLIAEVNRCIRQPLQQQVEDFERIFSVDPIHNPHVLRIYNENFQNLKEIDNKVESSNFYDDWLAFNEMVISFGKLSNQLDPNSSLRLFDLYVRFLEDLSTAFGHNRGWILHKLIRLTINYIIPLARQLDFQLYYKEYCSLPRLSHLASILLKIFNNIRSQTNEENQQKAKILLFIGNKLCLIYFKIENPLLCRNVFSNINTLNLNPKNYLKQEIITYRFYLSKFYLIKNQLIDSYQHLTWCLIHSPAKQHPNTTKILKLLIPISILIGKKPNFKYIKSVYLTQLPKFIIIYQQLFNSIHNGNYSQLNKVINMNFQYFKELNLLITIQNKAPILVVRNLFKKVWNILGRPLTLNYDALMGLVRVSGFDFNIDDLIVENLLISLIDQNLLKGKIFPRLRVVSLAKSNVFPPADQINFIRFGNGDETTLNPNDRWLMTY